MNKRASILAILVLGVAAAPASAQRPANQVPIRITWSPNAVPPREVAFEDRTGRSDFQPGPNYFEGARRAEGVYVSHRVSLTYPGSEVWLPIRTRFDLPRLSLRIDGPSDADCTGGEMDRLRGVGEGSTPSARIRAMLQARHMLTRVGTVCSAGSRDQLAAIMFRLNCSLADTEEYFELSPEVVELYRRHSSDRAAADREIRDCTRRSRALALRTLRTASLAANAGENYEHAAIHSGEMVALAADPEWQDALVDLGLGSSQTATDHIRAVHVDNLYDRHRQLAERGDMDAALALNDQLTALRSQEDYRAAFDQVRIDAARLWEDREYILARMPPASPLMFRPTAGRILDDVQDSAEADASPSPAAPAPRDVPPAASPPR